VSEVRKGKRLPLELLLPHLLELSDTPTLLDLPALFGNANPVELEVGFGKGSFLLAASQAQPAINFLGVEIERGLQRYVASRLAKRRLVNVRLIRADARLFVRDYLPTGVLRAIHVYFPDPWWKRRHRKRRVFTADFVRECERILHPGGRLHLATDVEEYFKVMQRLLAEQTSLQREDDIAGWFSSPDGEPVTNFQRKALLQSRSIWEAVYRKAAAPPLL
jgi:tRNA (guanine-N7-)-methyltransferase